MLKSYNKLNRAGIAFDAKHVFNRQLLEAEILPKYPEHRAEILAFCTHLSLTIRMVTVLVALITLFGGVLLYNR